MCGLIQEQSGMELVILVAYPVPCTQRIVKHVIRRICITYKENPHVCFAMSLVTMSFLIHYVYPLWNLKMRLGIWHEELPQQIDGILLLTMQQEAQVMVQYSTTQQDLTRSVYSMIRSIEIR